MTHVKFSSRFLTDMMLNMAPIGDSVKEEAKARFEVMKLMAEMEAMDMQTARLNAILEIEQMHSVRRSVADVAGDEAAVTAVRSAMAAAQVTAAQVAAASAAAKVATTPVPAPSSAPPACSPRQSSLTAAQSARLASLLEPDTDEVAKAALETRHAQTSTLRKLLNPTAADQSSSAASSETSMSGLAAAAALEASIAMMEAENSGH